MVDEPLQERIHNHKRIRLICAVLRRLDAFDERPRANTKYENRG
jgi:hypothetical protein